MYRFSFVRSVLAVVAWLSAGGTVRAATAPACDFSPVNQYNLQVSAGFWNPIIRYVSQKSGVRLNLKLGRTQAPLSFVAASDADHAGYRAFYADPPPTLR